MNETLALFPKPSQEPKLNTWHGTGVLTESEVQQIVQERRRELYDLFDRLGLDKKNIL